MRTSKIYWLTIIVILVALITTSGATGAATTKSLSTNFTLVNLGSSDAKVTVSYYKPDGSAWNGSAYTTATIRANGGQWIVRQYFDSGLESGVRGSVVVSSDQPLAGMVQILNRASGAPTSGAYSAITSGSTRAYIPLVTRQGVSATGISNSQIVIQNTTESAVNVEVRLIQLGSSSVTYTKQINNIQRGSSYTYDLSDETNLPSNWYGSAEIEAITPGGKIAVVSNLFTGADSLNSFNAFTEDDFDSVWFVPLLASKLTNSLNTSVGVQNVDSSTISAGDITLSCIKDPASSGANTLSLTNPNDIAPKGAYYFNTLIDSRFPTNWYGSCKVSVASGKKTVVTVQQRLVASQNQAMFEAIPGSSTATTVFIPLVAKRLSNGFATPVVIQNLGSSTATIDLIYTSGEGGIPPATYTRTTTIPPEAALQLNFRLLATESPNIPNGWVGSLKVVSRGSPAQPIHAYVQNTFLTMTTSPNGDQFMAYRAFTVSP